jgi:hypothetical protein
MSAAFSSAVAKFNVWTLRAREIFETKREVTTWLLRLSRSSVSVRKIQWARRGRGASCKSVLY